MTVDSSAAYRSAVRGVRLSARLSAALVGVALAMPSSAFAQCTDTFNYVGQIGPNLVPVQDLLPLGRGSSLAVLTSTINTVNSAFLASTSAFVAAPGNAKPNQQGQGLWARGIAGTVETSTTSVGTLDLTAIAQNATGTQNCKTSIKQSYLGMQFGYDIALLNRGGTGENWHFGITGGQVQAFLKDATPGSTYTNNAGLGPVTATAGDLKQETSVPYIGFYTTYSNKGFFADGMLRWDFYNNSFTSPSAGIAGSVGFDAQGFALMGNLGYTQALQDGWFIEPSAGMMYSKVGVNTLSISAFSNSYATGTVSVSDIQSLMGRATLRFGRNFTHDNIAYQPFFTASLFHEFSGDVTATSVEAGATSPNINGISLTSVSKGGLGTYGQFSLGTAVVLPNNVISFVRGDYRTGERIESWGINGGLRFNF